MRFPTLLFVCVLVACEARRGPAAAPIPSRARAASTAPPPTPAVSPEAPRTARDPRHVLDPRSAEGRAALTRYRSELGRGRQQARAGDQAGAVIAFRAALEAADDPHARCELGWALYRADQLDDAARELDRAVGGVRDDAVPTDRRNTYAACLYNRGRVAEARSEPPAEIAGFYRRSLALRPNETVGAALEAVGAPPVARACTQLCVGPLPTHEALRAALGPRLAAYHATQEFVCGDAESPAFAEDVVVASAAGKWLETRLVHYTAGGPCMAGWDRDVAIVEARLESGWWACAVDEALGGVNDSLLLNESSLVVRGAEVVATIAILNHDVEGAAECMECGDPESTQCADACDYEETARYERILRIRDGALVAPPDACLANF